MSTSDEFSDDPEVLSAHWRRQISENERLMRIMAWLPAFGLPVALALAFWHRLGGGLVALTVVVTASTGVYMTVVRRYEFRANLQEAEQQARDARATAKLP